EAATAAEQQRLAAVKAADEAKERVKTAALPTSPLPADAPRDPVALTRALQTELKRVGCDPGAVDGRWTAKTTDALSKFSRAAKIALTTEAATEAALQAVAASKRQVCLAVAKPDATSAKTQEPARRNGNKEVTTKKPTGNCVFAGSG